MTEKSECIHKISERQAVASSSHWGTSIITVVCLRCGKLLFKKSRDINNE
jgi:hypothetical protein